MKFINQIGWLLLGLIKLVQQAQGQNIVNVGFGYFTEARPIYVACARGWFNYQYSSTQYRVTCYPQTSGAYAVSRLDNEDLDIAVLGSTPLVQAFARGVDIQVVYVEGYKGDSQGIYVKEDSGIENPFDLKNKTLGVPFGSTMHYQVLYLLDIFSMTGEVELLDLSPTEITEYWDNESIDAAACWGSAREHVLDSSAKTLLSSGVMADWGRPTFNVVAANSKFINTHTPFMEYFTAVLASLTDSFIDRLGEMDPRNAQVWIPNNDPYTSYMPSLADSLMNPNEGRRNPSFSYITKVRRSLDLFLQQTTDEQLSCDYLGGDSYCNNPSHLQIAIQETALFLLDQKVISSMGPLVDILGNSGKFVNREILAAAKRIWGTGQNFLSGRDSSTVFPSFEIGRNGGNSNCKAEDKRSITSRTEFGDGASGYNGQSYSDNKDCWWVFQPGNSGFLSLSFLTVRVWSGDYIKVYADVFNCSPSSSTKVLLAQITGMDPITPQFKANSCILVHFETDGNQERSYGGLSNTGDGFRAEVTFNRDSCPGSSFHDEERGLCLCNGNAWGSDCSITDHCLGTSFIALKNSYTEESLASGTGTYPNDLDCVWEVQTNGENHVIFKVDYDLEPTFDLLELYSGSLASGAGATPFLTISGLSKSIEEYYIPTSGGAVTIRLVTDTRGRRTGFKGTVQAVSTSSPPVPPFCLAENKFESPEASTNLDYGLDKDYVIGRVVSQQEGYIVRPTPWAKDGGCKWYLSNNDVDVPNSKVDAIRLIFNFPLDLEPHPPSAVGDKIFIKSGDITDEIFVEQCTSDEVCSFPWQTGECDQERQACVLNTAVDVKVDPNSLLDTVISLVTDRNDAGENYYLGVDFDAIFVEECPGNAEDHCEDAGGRCVDGACMCEDIPCSCPCDGNTASKFNAAIFAGVVIPLLLVFLAIFLWYRRKKNMKSRAQKAIIAEKEEQLDAFRNSVVGMRTATTHYMPKIEMFDVSEEAPTPAPERSDSTQILPVKVQWCWKETSHVMSNHSPDMIAGNPADCWIKYDPASNTLLEDAFQKYSNKGNSKKYSTAIPRSGYKVDFGTMTQTKVQTGFQREVQRLVDVGQQQSSRGLSDRKEVDLDEVNMVGAIPEEVASEPQMVLVKGDIIQISSQRQDGWAFGTKLHHTDEATARELVHLATKGAAADEESNVFTDTGWFPLDNTEIPTGEELALLQSKVGGTDTLEPPSYWDPIADPSLVQRYPLQKGEDEYESVIKAFKSTLKPPSFPKKVKIVGVERIQNLAMWQSYVVKRQTICYRESGDSESSEAQKKALERFERHWLWHGTNIEVMDKIMQQGFNRSFCGKNATVYGKGVYFARDASYSAYPTYAVPDKHNHQYIMACRVIVGEYCPGVTNAVTPDVRDQATLQLYDSTVGLLGNDTMANPSIYVTYHDAQAYPEYLIKFKLH